MNVSELNTAIILEPGKFILDGAGNKINDPVFENYCRPMCLAKEISPVDLPLRIVARPESGPQANTTHSFQTAETFTKDSVGNILTAKTSQVAPQQPATNQVTHQEFTIEDAIKLGLIKPNGRQVAVAESSDGRVKPQDLDDSASPADVAEGLPNVEKLRPLPTPGLGSATESVDFSKIAKSVAAANKVELPPVVPQVAVTPIVTSISSAQVVPESLKTPEVTVATKRRRGQKALAPVAVPASTLKDVVSLPEADV